MNSKRHYNRGIPPYKFNEYTSCGVFILGPHKTFKRLLRLRQKHLPGNPGVVSIEHTTKHLRFVTCQNCLKNRVKSGTRHHADRDI